MWSYIEPYRSSESAHKYHQKISEILDDHLMKDREMSVPALFSLIIRGWTMGGYGYYMGKWILTIIDGMKRYKLLKYKNLEFEFENLEQVLLGKNYNLEKQIQVLENTVNSTKDKLHYWSIGPYKYRIEQFDDHKSGMDMLKKLRRRSHWPLYLDTEHGIGITPYTPIHEQEVKVALISITDVDSKKIYLWRIHKSTKEEVLEMLTYFRQLARTRTFATFGPEEFFQMETLDLQRYNAFPQVSLKEHAAKIGRTIDKSETCSDWCAIKLRWDQKMYAAMDSLVLHYLLCSYRSNPDLWDFHLCPEYFKEINQNFYHNKSKY